jgi:hypothetical protein
MSLQSGTVQGSDFRMAEDHRADTLIVATVLSDVIFSVSDYGHPCQCRHPENQG